MSPKNNKTRRSGLETPGFLSLTYARIIEFRQIGLPRIDGTLSLGTPSGYLLEIYHTGSGTANC